MYFLWSFIITSMKSSTVASRVCQQDEGRKAYVLELDRHTIVVAYQDLAVQHLVVS